MKCCPAMLALGDYLAQAASDEAEWDWITARAEEIAEQRDPGGTSAPTRHDIEQARRTLEA